MQVPSCFKKQFIRMSGLNTFICWDGVEKPIVFHFLGACAPLQIVQVTPSLPPSHPLGVINFHRSKNLSCINGFHSWLNIESNILFYKSSLVWTAIWDFCMKRDSSLPDNFMRKVSFTIQNYWKIIRKLHPRTPLFW